MQLDTVLLAMAMAALGLTTHSAARQAGLRPLLLALICSPGCCSVAWRFIRSVLAVLG